MYQAFVYFNLDQFSGGLFFFLILRFILTASFKKDLFIILFVYLAAQGLSCSIKDLLLQHAGF